MEEEVWRPVLGYEGLYEVSSFGRVRSLDRYVRHNYGGKCFKKGRLLKNHLNQTRHCQVKICKEGHIWFAFVHRLVYESFVGPIPYGMQVNHIDENPENNVLWNLNLMTPKQNTNWGTCIERRARKIAEARKGTELYETNPNAKPIVQYDLDGNYIAEYSCAKYAIEKFNLSQSSLSSNLNGRTKSCGGYKWKFKRDVA